MIILDVDKNDIVRYILNPRGDILATTNLSISYFISLGAKFNWGIRKFILED